MKSGISRYLVVLAVVFAVVIIAIPCKAADSEDDKAISEKLKLHRPGYDEIKSVKLSCSLDDPEAVWKYMTAPETPYIQRLALAYRGDEWFPPRFMRRLMEARNLLRSEEQLHYWGMKQHPHDALAFFLLRSWKSLQDIPDSLRKRKILGSQWTVPSAETDYPISWEEECDAPWPWQVQRALNALLGKCMSMPMTTEQSVDPWWDPWIAEALKIPCRTDREAVSFVEVTNTSASWKRPQVLSRWLRIAENPEFVDGARSVVFALSMPSQKMTSYAMILEFLKKSPHRNQISQLCIYLKNLMESMRSTSEYGPSWTPSSAVLLLGRYVNDPEYGTEWTRVNWAFSICEIVSDPPFKADYHMAMESPLVPQRLAEFKAWFDKHETELVAASEKEKPALDAIIEKIRKSK